MPKNNRMLSVVASLICAASAVALSGQQAPDNTANNKQHDVAADQQSNATADRAITQKIRKALMADKSLSTYAHNIKIITRDGLVTLKGPVQSEDEKQRVTSAAAQVVDADRIDNQLTVKGE